MGLQNGCTAYMGLEFGCPLDRYAEISYVVGNSAPNSKADGLGLRATFIDESDY